MSRITKLAYTQIAIEHLVDRKEIPADLQKDMEAAGVNVKQVRKYVESIIGKSDSDTE